MTNPFFDDDFRYTDTATRVEGDIFGALQPVMEKWYKEGYSPRDVAAMMVRAAIELECLFTLKKTTDKLYDV